MKRHYKVLFLKKIIIKDVDDSQSPKAISHFVKDWNILHTAKAVANAWSCVPSSALLKSWKNLLGEAVVPENNEQEKVRIVQLLNKVYSSNKCSEKEIEQWLQEDSRASTWRAMSDTELLEKFRNEENFENRDEDIT